MLYYLYFRVNIILLRELPFLSEGASCECAPCTVIGTGDLFFADYQRIVDSPSHGVL